MVRHFFVKQHPWMLNIRSHPAFREAFTTKLVKLSSRFEGLRHGLVANAASHLYASDEHMPLHELSLAYYSSAIGKVSLALGKPTGCDKDFDDALFIAVVYLYIHGVSVIHLHVSEKRPY